MQSSPSSLLSPLVVLDLVWQGKYHLPSSHPSYLHFLASHAFLPPCLVLPTVHKKIIYSLLQKLLSAFCICHYSNISFNMAKSYFLTNWKFFSPSNCRKQMKTQMVRCSLLLKYMNTKYYASLYVHKRLFLSSL